MAQAIRDSRSERKKLEFRMTVEQAEMVEALKEKYRTDSASHVIRCLIEDGFSAMEEKRKEVDRTT